MTERRWVHYEAIEHDNECPGEGYVEIDTEDASLRALLAAQEARAQRVEKAARAVVDGNHACLYKPYGTNCTLYDALRAALSQHADERGHDYENDGNGVCVHCGYKVVPAQPAATGEGDK
jgi:hypothetical protein